MKFDSNIQEVIETIVDSGNLDTDAVRGTQVYSQSYLEEANIEP